MAYRQNRAHLELLCKRFPACFAYEGWKRRPLKIGIYHDLLAALDGALAPAELRVALFFYTHDRHYRARLWKGAYRFDLDGNITGRVTKEHAAPGAKCGLRRAPPKPEPAPAPPARLSLAGLREAAKRRLATAAQVQEKTP